MLAYMYRSSWCVSTYARRRMHRKLIAALWTHARRTLYHIIYDAATAAAMLHARSNENER